MGLCRLAILGVDGLGYKGSVEVRGRSDVPFGILLLSKQQKTPCSLINCQLSAYPDPLQKIRESEIIIILHYSSLPLPMPFHFLPSPSLLLFSCFADTVLEGRLLELGSTTTGSCYLLTK